jgi:hypothetical protein
MKYFWKDFLISLVLKSIIMGSIVAGTFICSSDSDLALFGVLFYFIGLFGVDIYAFYNKYYK